jgi:hypothetical protein
VRGPRSRRSATTSTASQWVYRGRRQESRGGDRNDNGAEKPVGFGFGAVQQQAIFPGAFQRAVEIGGLLKSIEGGQIVPRGGGGDIRPLTAEGVPGFAVRTVNQHYDDWRHTEGDTFDKITPRDFQLQVASLAVLSYVLADMPERLSEMK